jgi:hypothetical protein
MRINVSETKCVTSGNIFKLRSISPTTYQAVKSTYSMQLLVLTPAAYFLEYPNKNNNLIYSIIS